MMTIISFFQISERILLKWQKLEINHSVIYLLILFIFFSFTTNLYSKGYVKKKYYYKKQLWDNIKKEYHFNKLIDPNDTKDQSSYYELYKGKKGVFLYSKKYVNSKLHSIFFFNKRKQVRYFIFYLDGIKRSAVFYSAPKIKTEKHLYDLLSGRIIKKIYYRKDGKTTLKEDFFEHLNLRKTILYYSSGKKRSFTEHFEGRKTYYDRKGKVTKIKRFRPKIIY